MIRRPPRSTRTDNTLSLHDALPIFIHDIKGENWRLTAGWRARFSHVLLFNLTDPRSAKYNPLLEVRKGANEVRDVQNIADILVDPEGALERRNHWEKTSHSLLVGAILHILYAEEEKTLARVATFLSDPQRPFTTTLRRLLRSEEHTSELQSLMRISYAVFCLKKTIIYHNY